MEIAELVGLRVQHARQQHDMSQQHVGAALAAYLGKPWSRQAVSAAEKGGRQFTIAELTALAAVLGTTVVDLTAPSGTASEVQLPAATLTTEHYAALHIGDRSARETELAEEVDRLRLAVHSFMELREEFNATAKSVAPPLKNADRRALEHAKQARKGVSRSEKR